MGVGELVFELLCDLVVDPEVSEVGRNTIFVASTLVESGEDKTGN